MKKAVQGLIALALLLLFAATVMAGSAAGMNADEALKKLMDGNRRFVSETYNRGDIGPGRRAELSKGQQPFAIIVDCADSRVVPEFIFDQGLGDLFVIRTAGNIVDDIAIGSVEYAVEHLGVRLVLVLGHDDCGAVKATVAGGKAEGHIDAIVQAIKPAVAIARQKPGNLLNNAIAQNVDMVVERLQTSQPILAHALQTGAVKIVGGVYSLKDGSVELRIASPISP
jgi:carbonic anhydrase